MATWTEFQTARPEMAQLLVDLLAHVPIAYLATVRRDGSPRVHPVCPIIAEGRMYVAVAGSGREHPSPKRFDLQNDGRYALHAMPGQRDDEFYISGRAHRVESAAAREAIRLAAGHTIHDADWLFELDIEFAMTAYWEHMGEPNTYAVRQTWLP